MATVPFDITITLGSGVRRLRLTPSVALTINPIDAQVAQATLEAVTGTGALATLTVRGTARFSLSATAGAGTLATIKPFASVLTSLTAVSGQWVAGESPAPGTGKLMDSARRRWVPIRYRATGAVVPIRES